jgi:hypothetical protein
MSFPKNISKLIKNSSGVIQFAKDGKYEESWIISINDSRPTIEEIKNYVEADNYQKLIVEYIWNQDIDEERYVLTVIQDDGCIEKDRNKFVEKCLGIFYGELSFDDLVKQIDKQIVGREFLLQHPVQRVRLGVFNHWFSVGPIEMWDTGDDLSKEVIEQKIKVRPEVEKSNLNYQGLAFIYNFDGSLPGPYHILKTPTCHKKDEGWAVDTDLVYENMRGMVKGN